MADRVSPDAIRAAFAEAMSEMYRAEVPLYGDLLTIVAQVNKDVLARDNALRARLTDSGDRVRLGQERHGAIRVGTADELRLLARVFAVMGMEPVGYYDLSVAGLPVHSTAFRPTDRAALLASPFRLFTSLLRLDRIADKGLRRQAGEVLARRKIAGPRMAELLERAENDGGLTAEHADGFVAEALEIFRWHGRATVDGASYRALRAAHPLIADIVCFPGPHINHLTPATLDIDAAQQEMLARGIEAKDKIEGPPRRAVPILLRQTSFLALGEPVDFDGEQATHTARFGEIEQRGLALTAAGRTLYDACLASGDFSNFPDEMGALRSEGLGWFRFRLVDPARCKGDDPDGWIAAGGIVADPVLYEDFLPVSAAGIFRSNLGSSEEGPAPAGSDAQASFEEALGREVIDPQALYRSESEVSLAAVRAALRA